MNTYMNETTAAAIKGKAPNLFPSDEEETRAEFWDTLCLLAPNSFQGPIFEQLKEDVASFHVGLKDTLNDVREKKDLNLVTLFDGHLVYGRFFRIEYRKNRAMWAKLNRDLYISFFFDIWRTYKKGDSLEENSALIGIAWRGYSDMASLSLCGDYSTKWWGMFGLSSWRVQRFFGGALDHKKPEHHNVAYLRIADTSCESFNQLLDMMKDFLAKTK